MPNKPLATAEAEHRAGLPVLAFSTARQFERWLLRQPAGSKGLWLKLAKQAAGVRCIGKPAAVEVALCHGWIDGQLNPYDHHYWLVRFTPRSSKSRWSQINRETVMRLMAEGRVSPAGLAQVEAAQADGRWERAYAPPSRVEVPPDLQASLDANPAAKAFFATLTGSNRYAVLYRVGDAKTEKNRQARIDKFVGMLARGEVLHPPRPRSTDPDAVKD